jgi:hypothetical protein
VLARRVGVAHTQRRPLASAAWHQLWRLLSGDPWHAVAWHARGAREAGVGHQEVLDASAMTALRTRIRELRQEPVLSVDEQEELDTLTRELALASGLGGRSRSFTDVPERARTAVRKALKRAIEQITAANPVIGQHLEKGIETGTICRYRVPGSER